MSPRVPNPFPWKPLTLTDAYSPRPPTEWVLDGILPTESLSILYGAPGTLKSMLALDLLACVAAGKPWLEPLPQIPTRQGNALLVDFDNGHRVTLSRLEAIGRGHGLGATAALFAVSMGEPWLRLNDTGNLLSPTPNAHWERLADYIEAMGASICVIDNLGLVSGDADENSADMVPILGSLRRVAESTCCALITIHHQRKTIGGRAGVRTGDTLRGHSSIEASLDLALLVTRDGDNLTLEASKSRNGDIDPMGALWTYSHKAGTHDLEQARFWRANPQSQDLTIAIRSAILAALQVGSLNQSELVTVVKQCEPKASRDRILRAAEALERRGIVSIQPGAARNAKVYSLVLQPQP